MRSFAIIPAAGHSRRMGRPKLLLPWSDATVIEQVVRRWRLAAVTRVVIVVRGDDGDLAERCRGAAAGTASADAPPLAPVDIVRPAVDPPDMKASVREALEHVARTYAPTGSDVWLMAPADMPHLSTEVVNGLLHAARDRPACILVPVAGRRRGHPVLFPFALADAVAELGPDEGINRLLERAPVCELDLGPEGIAPDLDTPEDYARLVERPGPR